MGPGAHALEARVPYANQGLGGPGIDVAVVRETAVIIVGEIGGAFAVASNLKRLNGRHRVHELRLVVGGDEPPDPISGLGKPPESLLALDHLKGSRLGRRRGR